MCQKKKKKYTKIYKNIEVWNWIDNRVSQIKTNWVWEFFGHNQCFNWREYLKNGLIWFNLEWKNLKFKNNFEINSQVRSQLNT